MDPEQPEVAFYYPGWIWNFSDWAKNLVLFFDGIALLVPAYMRDAPFHADPAIAQGLQDQGLLTILEPETFIDKTVAESLASTMVDVLASGLLDDLATNQPQDFQELSWSRMGGFADTGLAEMVLEELLARGLARKSEDDVSIPLHPMVRSLILVLLAQALRPVGRNLNIDLAPATDQPNIHQALSELLNLPLLPSAGHVVSLDLQTVGVDLGPIPLDEVLDFRKQHGPMYRAYRHDLKQFLAILATLPEGERAEALNLRREEIADAANNLRQTAQRAWIQPVSFSLSLAGAVWTAVSGDPLGALLAAGAAGAGLAATGSTQLDAHSYLFQAHHQFPPTGLR